MKFSLPYNNSDPDIYFKTFEPYLNYIHSFYFGLPYILPVHNPRKISPIAAIEQYSNTLRFLELVRGKTVTVLCLNTIALADDFRKFEFQIVKEIVPLVQVYGLSAVNVASPALAQCIHKIIPNLQIHTSCNTISFLNKTADYWNENFGTTVFNLPREALRTPWLLENFKSTGYVSKCIVNEACLYGCPGIIEHCAAFLNQSRPYVFCENTGGRLSDIFKSNFIPPQRLSYFEDVIDIAKIVGRDWDTDRIKETFLDYLNGNANAEIIRILHGRLRHRIEDNHIKIKAGQWPKKTLTCECKECHTCNICQKAMIHAIEKSGIDFANLKHPI